MNMKSDKMQCIAYDWKWLDLFANERHEIICQMIKEKGSVTTSRLCREFNVSVETVRKDLLSLEKSHELKRVHGGAVRADAARYTTLQERSKRNIEEKLELSGLAERFIKDGDTIYVDAGSTAVQFVKVLKKFKNLTVVTSSLDVCVELRGCYNIDLILCGGNFMEKENVFCGGLNNDMLKTVNCDKAFLFPSGISMDKGVTVFSPMFTLMYETLISRSDEVFFLADSDKFEKHATYTAAELCSEFVFITDSKLPADIKNKYRENGLTVISEKIDISGI